MPNHCYSHNIDYAYQTECPECRAEEASRNRREMLELQKEDSDGDWKRHEELVQLREREIAKRWNPGDYTCPECLYITLKRGASRCPACQAAIGQDYWPPVYEREILQAEERAKAERAKAAAEPRLKNVHGVVKRIDANHGFGWIEQADGSQVFFHHSEIKGDLLGSMERLRAIQDGQRVTFDIEQGLKGPRAVNVEKDI